MPSQVTISSGLTLKVPSAGSSGWAQQFLDDFARPISGHDHTGGGKGLQIGSGGIAAAAITTAKLADGAVTTAKLGAAVDTANIVNLAVTTGKIADAAITEAKIAPETITSASLADSSVGTSELATGAVTTDKIGIKAVDTSELASGAVTTDILADSSVSTVKIAAGAITSTKIGAGEVGTTSLASGGVTAAKIASGVLPPLVSSVTPGTISNSLVETTLMQFTIPAGVMASARSLRFQFLGEYGRNAAGSTTFTVKVYFSSTKFSEMSFVITAAHASNKGSFQVEGTIQNITASSQKAHTKLTYQFAPTADAQSPGNGVFKTSWHRSMAEDTSSSKSLFISVTMDQADSTVAASIVAGNVELL